MEFWSFPPSYDATYFPPSESRYWFARRETMPAGEREQAILDRLRLVCRYAYDHSPFYRRRWAEAGFHPDHLRSLEDFEDKVPIVTKKDLRESQAASPPFGEYLCVPDNEIFHVHGTSGTTGRPTAFAIGRSDWSAIANAHARGSCGRWGCAQATRSASPQSLASTWVGSAGERRAARRQSISVRGWRAGHDHTLRSVA